MTKIRFWSNINKYSLETKSLVVSTAFAEQLHNSISTLMKDHVNIGVPNISRGGYTANLRCVVGDEVWNFSVKNPMGAFKEVITVCNSIFDDVLKNENEINEERYSRHLELLVKDI